MNIQIDYLPSIKAFSEQRIDDLLDNKGMDAIVKAAKIQELRAIIALCDGLTGQKQLFEGLLPVNL